MRGGGSNRSQSFLNRWRDFLLECLCEGALPSNADKVQMFFEALLGLGEHA